MQTGESLNGLGKMLLRYGEFTTREGSFTQCQMATRITGVTSKRLVPVAFRVACWMAVLLEVFPDQKELVGRFNIFWCERFFGLLAIASELRTVDRLVT